MKIQKLYNLDESRTIVFREELVTIPEDSDGRVYLTHIPKKGTLNIQTTEGKYFKVIDNGEPLPGEVFCDYREEYDYVSAKGILIFNKSDISKGYGFNIEYVPVASRIDAGVINQLIDFNNIYNDNIWSKDDLLNPENENIILWTAILNRPLLATEDEDGLLSKEDKRKLNDIPAGEISTPLTSLVFTTNSAVPDPTTIQPTYWGDPTNIKLNTGFAVTKTGDNSIAVSLIKNDLIDVLGLTYNYLAALPGATGDDKSPAGPSSENKYVLDSDIRLINARAPLTHQHSIDQIISLEEVLSGKSDINHTHNLTDITGWEQAKGEDGKSPQVEVASTVTLPAGQQAQVINVTGDPFDVQLQFKIPKGADGAMRWEDLTEEQKEQMQIVGDKGDPGIPAAVLVGECHTGEPGTDVIVTGSDPHEVYIGGEVYSASTLNFTIPRGDKGDLGISGAVSVGAVTTTDNNKEAHVVIHPPEIIEIDGVYYNTSKIDFELPRGPRGTASASKLSFSENDARWSEYDEDTELYTLTIRAIGAVPVTMAYESISDGMFEPVVASVNFDYTNVYVKCDHKFSGCVYVEGIEQTGE